MKGKYLGIDVGGSGIKGAIVDLKKGELITERFRVPTPKPSLPSALGEAFNEVVEHFQWNDVIGCGFPAIIKDGISYSASNIHKKWMGANVSKILGKASGCKVLVSNDADVAGLAEVHYGAGRNATGTILMITIGSGLGSGLFINGELVPNSELGHVYLKDMDIIAERYAADSARKNEGLSWEEWGLRFDKYLRHIEFLFSPDLFILGGGGSKKFDQFSHVLTCKTETVPAELKNHAGIIGAAYYANKKKSLILESKTL